MDYEHKNTSVEGHFRVVHCNQFDFLKPACSFMWLNSNVMMLYSKASGFLFFQDRVIAIPGGFVEATVLGDIHSSNFRFLCNVEANDMR